MKKYRVTLVSMAILLLIAFGPAQLINAASNNEIQTTETRDISGKWGDMSDGATWNFADGILTISEGVIGNSTNRPWGGNPDFIGADIKTIVIGDNVVVGEDATSLFSVLPNVTSFVGLEKLDTTRTTNMSKMFNGDKAIKDLGLSGFQTAQVTTMGSMFASMDSLKNINLSNWVISENNSVSNLIPQSSSLASLTLKNTRVNKAGFKFYNKTSARYLDLGNSTISDPEIARNLTGDELVAAVNADADNPNASGVWIIEPEKVPTTGYKSELKYWSKVDGLTKEQVFSVDLSLIPIYVGAIFQVPVIPIEGYRADPAMLTVQAGKSSLVRLIPNDSDYVIYTKIQYYTGNGEVMIPSNISSLDASLIDPVVQIEDASKYEVGETFTVAVPVIEGYTADKTEVTVKVVSNNVLAVVDGSINGADYVTYTKNLEEKIPYVGDGKVVINSNLAEEIAVTYSDYQDLVVGDVIDITVPDQSGYTKDKTTIQALVKDANTIEIINPETDGFVTYTKKSTGGGGGSVTPEDPDTIIGKYQTLAVYSDLDSAQLYDSKGDLVTDRQLAAGSAWISDKIWTKKTKTGQILYRVATNEWVKDEDVYLYEATSAVVQTPATIEYVTLVNERGQRVKNRALAADTKWQTDRIIELNGQKYYRVATHEFVSATDVDII